MSHYINGARLDGVVAQPRKVWVELVQSPRLSHLERELLETARGAILGSGCSVNRNAVVVYDDALMTSVPGLALPAALALLGDERVPLGKAARYLFWGDLRLSGDLRPCRGTLAVAELASRMGLGLILPATDGLAGEAASIVGAGVWRFRSLFDVGAFLRGELNVPRTVPPALLDGPRYPDTESCRYPSEVLRTLEDVAVSGQALFLEGPSGCGAAMLAARLPGILPPLPLEEGREVRRIHSCAGLTREGVATRPFRAPHHTISEAGLLGSGRHPGELTLAHNGVLFVDAAGEWLRAQRELVTLAMTEGSACGMPSRFRLVVHATMCPCGSAGRPGAWCRCSSELLKSYRKRVDPWRALCPVHLALSPPPLPWDAVDGERSASIQARVVCRIKGEKWLPPVEDPDSF